MYLLRKLDKVLPEDPSIPCLGIYPDDALTSSKDTCFTIFIEALFIIANRGIDTENVIYLHNGVLLSY